MEWFLGRMAESPSVVLNLPIVDESGVVTGYEELPIVVEDDSYRYRKIMDEHTLNLKFKWPGYKEIPIGAFCDYQGLRYTLELPENIVKNGERNFEYDLVMQSDQFQLTKYMVRNIVPGDSRLKFSYTARPEEFLRLIVENMNKRDPEERWSFDPLHVESSEKTVSFNHNSCMEALQMVAEAFETEWEVRGKTILLHKVEYFKDKPLKLSYGRGNGFLPGLGRSEYSDVKPVERLFVGGGERNIDPSSYRKNESTGQVVSRELLLPTEKIIKFDGLHFEGEEGFDESRAREYITDKDGFSLCRVDKAELVGLIEGSLDCAHIYPMREGEVAEVVVVDEDKHFYDFIDIDENIPNYTDYLIEGETMTVIFQSGMLSGREFEVKYKHSGHFEIVPQTLDGVEMPNEYYRPRKGDLYGVFNVTLPNAYIEEAERSMLKEAVRYLYEYEEPRFTFTGTMDGIWAKKNWGNVGGWLVLGGYINFSDAQFMPKGLDIRIVSIKDYVNNPYKPEIELSNKAQSGSWLHNMERKVEADEVTTETKDREVKQYAKRRFRNVVETVEMLSGSMLDFSQGIRPMFVNTMQAVIGDESLQFEYETRENGERFEYLPQTKQLFSPEGILTHKTLGIDFISSKEAEREYRFWVMPQSYSIPLVEPDKYYYLYAVVPANEYGQGVWGEFHLSDKAIGMYDSAEHYHLLVGLLNSEFEGDREFTPLYGYTEILPGRITTNLLRSAEGDSYLNLKDGTLLLADNGYRRGMDFGLTREEQLTIKGAVNADRAQIGGFIIDNDKFESLEGRKIGEVDTPNIALVGKDGSGHLAAGEISWDQQGSFKAGIFEVPYRQDLVLVRGEEGKNGATMGNIIITNREIGDISTSHKPFGDDDSFKESRRNDEPPLSLKNTHLAMVEHSVSAPLGQLVVYAVDMEVELSGRVSAGSFGGDEGEVAAQLICNSRLQLLVNGEVIHNEALRQFDMYVNAKDGLNPSDQDMVEEKQTKSVAVNNGDKITIRIYTASTYLNTIHPGSGALAVCQATLSANLKVSGTSLIRETIIGSDGILVRQDENNSFLVKREADNMIGVYITELPMDSQGVGKGRLYRMADGTLKVKM